MQPVDQRIVQLLSDALTFELTVTNTYFLHARMLDNWGLPRLGKVFYDLLEERDARGLKDVALLRIEQLYPFPDKPLIDELAQLGNAAELVWCQEEPRNMGAWTFVAPHLGQVMAQLGMPGRPRYAGRPEAAAPATGILKRHNKEQTALVAEALGA